MAGRRGRRRKQLLDELKEERGYWKLKEEALDRTVPRENSLLKSLWTCRKTVNRMDVMSEWCTCVVLWTVQLQRPVNGSELCSDAADKFETGGLFMCGVWGSHTTTDVKGLVFLNIARCWQICICIYVYVYIYIYIYIYQRLFVECRVTTWRQHEICFIYLSVSQR